jgi:hypothetical protein
MYVIEDTISKNDVAPILSLALSNYVDLINKVVKISGPTSSLCKTILKVEINEYLQDLITGHHGMPGSIAIARENSSQDIVGFALGMESLAPEHCGISYAAVRNDMRRNGILRSMLSSFQNRYSTIELSCHPKSVIIYQNLGFRVCGRQQVQVAMRWGVPRPQGSMPTVNVEIFESVRLETAAAGRTVSQKNWETLEKARIKRVAEIEKLVGSQLPIQYLSISD